MELRTRRQVYVVLVNDSIVSKRDLSPILLKLQSRKAFVTFIRLVVLTVGGCCTSDWDIDSKDKKALFQVAVNLIPASIAHQAGASRVSTRAVRTRCALTHWRSSCLQWVPSSTKVCAIGAKRWILEVNTVESVGIKLAVIISINGESPCRLQRASFT